MATLPGLVIKIGANTKDAIDGLNKVNRAMGSSASGATRLSTTWRKVGPAVAAAGAAFAALSIKLGVDAVQAAKEEEVSVSRLSQTLKNLGLASSDARIEKFIDDMQFATGIADNDLRPAYDRLVRSTENVAEAQRAIGIAADIAAAKQRNVTDVANILGKAYDGNTMALGRLGVGLDKAVLKSGDMNVITDELSRLFKGQAAAAADTLTGRANILRISIDELSEAFGKGLVGSGEDSAAKMEEITQQLRDMQPQAERAGENVRNVASGALTMLDRLTATADVLERGDFASFWDMMKAGASGTDEAFANIINRVNSVGTQFEYTQYAAYKARSGMYDYLTAAEDATQATDDQTASIKRLQAALSGLDTRQSVMEKRFNLQQLIAGGPGKSGQRKGPGGKMTSFTTLADQKEFAFAVASGSRDLASDLLGQGKRGRARDQLAQARSIIRGLGLSDTFESNLLGTLRTPSALRPGARTRPGTPQTGAEVGSVNYNFYGGINVDSNEAAQQAAKEARRLASLSGDRYAGMAATGRGFRR